MEPAVDSKYTKAMKKNKGRPLLIQRNVNS